MSTMTLCAHSRGRREARLRWLIAAILLPIAVLLAMNLKAVQERADAALAWVGASADSVSRDGHSGQDAAGLTVDLGRALTGNIDRDMNGQAPTALTLMKASGCRVEVVEAGIFIPCDARVAYAAEGRSFALRIVDRHGTSSTFNPHGLPTAALVGQEIRS